MIYDPVTGGGAVQRRSKEAAVNLGASAVIYGSTGRAFDSPRRNEIPTNGIARRSSISRRGSFFAFNQPRLVRVSALRTSQLEGTEETRQRSARRLV